MVWQVKALAAKLVTCVQIYDPYSEGGEPIPVVCPLIHVTCMHIYTNVQEHMCRVSVANMFMLSSRLTVYSVSRG